MPTPATHLAAESLLVGRAEEQRRLAHAVDSLGARRLQVLLLQGEPGIGKSRLLAEVVRLADAAGAQVLAGRALEHESERPFGLIAGALGVGRPAADDVRGTFAVVDELVDHLVGLAATPLVLLVDDLQWADRPSLAVLTEVARAELPLLLVGARRPTPTTAELATFVDLVDDRGGLLDVAPLDRSAVESLVRESLGSVGPSVLHQVARAGGNPLFALELLAALRADAALETAAGVVEAHEVGLPPSLRTAILRRVRALSPPSRDVLAVASVLGSCFAVRDLATALDIEPSQLLSALAELRAAGLLVEAGEDVEFRHDVVRESVYDDLGQSTRTALHAQIGGRLAAAGAPALVVAAHLAHGARPGDEVAVDWLRRAAAEVAGTDPAGAGRLLDRAVRLARLDDPARDAATNELVRALLWAGRFDEAERRARTVLDRAHDPEVGAALHYSLARLLVYQGRVGESVAELEAALAGPALTDDARARLLGDLALRHGWTGDAAALTRAADEAVRLGTRCGDDLAVSTARSALAWQATLHGDLPRALSHAEAAMADPRQGEAVHPVQARFYRAWALLAADRVDEAIAVSTEALAAAHRLGAAWAEPLAHAQLALERYAAGTWDDALIDAETAIELAGRTGVTIWAPAAQLVVARIAAHRSDQLAATTALSGADTVVRLAGGPHFLRGRLLDAAARVATDPQEALRLRRAAWAASTTFGSVVDRLELGPGFVRDLLACNDSGGAEAVTADVRAVADRAGTRSAQAAALRCEALLRQEPAAAAEAVDLLRAGGRGEQLAAVCEELAGLAGDRAGQVALIEEALELYLALDASHDVARLRDRLHAAGVAKAVRSPRPRTGWESLTASERRVVGLVAEGLTNPEIAGRLVLSRRTVESHVSRALAKLGLRSRVELAAAVARGELQPDPS